MGVKKSADPHPLLRLSVCSSSTSDPFPSHSSPMSSDVSDDGEDEGEAEGWSPNLSPAGPSRPRGGGASDPPPPSYDQVLEIVLENVLEFLTSRRDRNAASLVRRSWYRAEARTRRDLFVGNCYAVSPSRAVARFPRARSLVLKGRPRFADFNLVPPGWGARFAPWAAAYPYLERLSLKRVTVANDDLALIARSLAASFRDLSLICCDGFGTAGLAAVAAHCRYLRVLDLIDNDVEDEEDEVVDWISAFPATSATCLESLVFECLSCAVNFKALEALVARSPSLRRLRVNHHISISQLRRLMERAPKLTHLGTGSFHTSAGHGGTDAEVGLRSAFLAGSRSLVCLSGFRDLEPEYLPAIYPACANLISLNISYAEITADQLRPVILQCHNLQTFWVLDTLRDEGLQAVASTCKDLRELRVFPLDATEDSEGSVSDIGLVAISNGCQKLRSILYFCQQMTNSAVITMSNNCPELEVFRLCIMGRHRPDRFSGEPMDEGFRSIVKNCRKLTRLAVSGLLTDKAFRYIGQYGSSVRTLSVAFAGNSDRGLSYVLQGCTKLQKLEIRDSPFGDVGLLSGIQHYYNMRFLWMSSCNLTHGGCKAVAQALPHLVVEVIDGNGEAVEKLYMYRSLAGPRGDAPPFVTIL